MAGDIIMDELFYNYKLRIYVLYKYKFPIQSVKFYYVINTKATDYKKQ